MKPNSVKVFTFPMKAPDGAVLRNDRSAIKQLELWLTYQRYYCEHKPSVTISVKEHEWMEVGAWVYKHFDEVSGVSFLPHSDHSYQQAPYEDCTKAEYTKLAKKMPKSVDWNLISKYELTDMTVGSKTLACTGSVCELVDLVEEDNDQE
jgi:ribonucleoside-diphosphate reductase alpha chain